MLWKPLMKAAPAPVGGGWTAPTITQVFNAASFQTVYTSAALTAQTGTDRLMVLYVGTRTRNPAFTTITCEYGTQAFTQAIAHFPSAASRPSSSIFYIKDADIPTGSHQIKITFSNLPAGCVAYLAEWVGVNQTTPMGTGVEGTSQTQNNPSVTVNLTATDSLMLSCATIIEGTNASPATLSPVGAVEVGDAQPASNRCASQSAYEEPGASGNNTHTHTFGSGANQAMAVGIEMYPV